MTDGRTNLAYTVTIYTFAASVCAVLGYVSDSWWEAAVYVLTLAVVASVYAELRHRERVASDDEEVSTHD